MWTLLLTLACSSDSETIGVFVRGGVLVAEGEGRPAGDRVFVARDWSPGDRHDGRVVPRQPGCEPLYQVPLGDVAREVAQGLVPDTAVAFSPDGERLAIGSYHGEVRVHDAWTGVLQGSRTLSEALVKHVAWSPDGKTLYAAEQSPDASVVALTVPELEERWRVRLADRVGSSPRPADDLYGVYQLPAAYGLVVEPAGTVLVAATHGWGAGEDRKNRSQLLRIDAEGEVVAAWPDEPADATMLHAAVGGDRIAVPLGRSAAGEAPDELPIGGVQLLDGRLEPLGERLYEPLGPWFQSAFVWQALGLHDDEVGVGLGDGRLFLGDRRLDLGSPVEVGDVPIVAAVSHLVVDGDDALVITGGTHIPYGAARPELRPPEAHPNANSFFRVDVETAKISGVWRGPYALQGISTSSREVLIGAGARSHDSRHDLYGGLVFGEDPELRTVCPTEGPVFFRHDIADNGLVALVEYPVQTDDGLRGAYRVTVFR